MENNHRFRSLVEHPATPYLFGAIGWLSAWQIQKLFMKLVPQIDYHLGIALIFLPAGIRTLSVLVFGFRGAIGIFIGAMISTFHYMGNLPNFNLLFSILVSAISAIAAWIAMVAVCHIRRIDNDLSQLRFGDIISIVISQGIISSALHQILFRTTQITEEYEPVNDEYLVIDWAAMATGDIIGSMICLLTAVSILKFIHKITIDKAW